jgi:DNA-binding NarL/FixJ family response regulator
MQPLPRVNVLIAVKPLSLLRVIEHLLHSERSIRVVSRPDEALRLVQQAKRSQPDLIIANAKLLEDGACEVLREIKRASPNSKVIVLGFNASSVFSGCDREVDAYLDEEMLVAQLLDVARKLAWISGSEPGPDRAAVRRRHRS